jgi:hypothetical protein
MDLLHKLLGNMGLFILLTVIILILLFLLALLLINRHILYKSTLLRNVVKKNKSVWVQRVFLTMTLVMLFFNFFSNGYSINGETNSDPKLISPLIQEKVSIDNDNTELYKGLYVQLVENLQRNSKQYLTIKHYYRDFIPKVYLTNTII